MRKVISVIKVLFGTTARKYPGFFVLKVLRLIITTAMPFIALFISPLIVDEIVGNRDVKRLITLAVILVAGEALCQIGNDLCNNFINRYSTRLERYFSVLIGRHVMELDFQLTEDKEALEQIEKATTGMEWYSGGVHGVSDQFFNFLGNLFKAVGYITVIALHAPILLLVMAVYSAVNALFVSKLNKVSIEAFAKLSKVNRLFGYFGWETVDPRYGKDIRLYNAKGLMLDSWKENTRKSNEHWKWQGEISARYDLASTLLALVRSIFAYIYVALLAIRKFISVGTFTQLIAAETGLNNSIGGMVNSVTELVKRCNYAYEYVVFMNYPEALTKGTRPVEKKEHEIEFRHVSFAYPKTDRKVLDDVSIKITPGEHLSIVGLNGAGKTTFIKLLCRLYDPTEGEILLDGVDIREYDYEQYMEQFAPVFQDFKLFAFSVAENIAFTDKEKDVNALTDRVGLHDFVDKLPKGVDTNIFKFFDEEGVEPSGGEQQKIAIARALCKDAPVVILDEPTAALDPIAEYEIYKQFNSLVGGKTAFYISHRLSSCQFCDHIAVFSEGHIAEYGTHAELEHIKDGIYSRMFEAQA
ncbi:MAG: ABC transporter ATP-binding protein/permease, partial [Lachnospiraceae bacterium]|nr:ABC transporter ATP-binding protein/permease [Lachnospiraceae bacterium]